MGRTYRHRKRQRYENRGQQRDASIESQHGLGRLKQLCVSHECTNDLKSLRPYNFADSGRGLQTLADIRSGHTLISIPHSLLITTRVAIRDQQIKSAVDRAARKPTAVVLLCAFLLFERSKEDRSPWFYYIKSVPTIYSTLLYMNQLDLVFLDVELRQDYDTVKESVDRVFDEVKAIFSEILGLVSYEDILWAWHVVNTRSVYMNQPYLKEVRTSAEDKDDSALAPFLDLLNHTHTAQVKAGYNAVKGCYEIVTYDSYKRYEQVFISYGTHDNRTLLLQYGFCIRGNINDYIKFIPENILNCGLSDTAHSRSSVYLKLKKNNLDKGLVCDASGLSWNLFGAVELVSQEAGVSLSESLRRLIDDSVNERLGLLTRLQTLRSSHVERTTNELFILDMLTILYEDEVSLLNNAQFSTERTEGTT